MGCHRPDLLVVSELTTALDALLEEHRRLGSPVGDYLRPGASRAAVERRLGSIGLPAPPDVVDLYGWADGTDEPAWQREAPRAPFLRFIGDAFYPPLDDAVRWCATVRQLARDLAEGSIDPIDREAFWRPIWLPVLRPDRGEWAVVCAAGEQATVHRVDWGQPGAGRQHPNLAGLFRSAADELRDGFVWLAEEQVLLRRDVAALRQPRTRPG